MLQLCNIRANAMVGFLQAIDDSFEGELRVLEESPGIQPERPGYNTCEFEDTSLQLIKIEYSNRNISRTVVQAVESHPGN